MSAVVILLEGLVVRIPLTRCVCELMREVESGMKTVVLGVGGIIFPVV